MSDSSILTAERREIVGTSAARKVRSAGRIPASLQADGESAHLDISIDEREFLTSRRQHVHLYDIDVEGEVSSAIVRELQWDAFGDNIIHVEFRRVQRGVEIESVVALTTVGQANGVVNLLVSQIALFKMVLSNGHNVRITWSNKAVKQDLDILHRRFEAVPLALPRTDPDALG